MSVTRSVVYGVVGACKTESSQKPVLLHSTVAQALVDWKKRSAYTKPDDWVFARRCRGRRPYSGQAILRKYIRPVALHLGIQKRFGWHTFRHTYSTLLRSVGTEFKVMQELLRHSTLRSTLDVYTQAVTPAKLAASGGRVVCPFFRWKRRSTFCTTGRGSRIAAKRAQKGRETRPFSALDGFKRTRLTLLE
jgi:integrase